LGGVRCRTVLISIELAELGLPHQDRNINTTEIFSKQLSARLGDREQSSSRRREKTGFGQIKFGPVDTIMQNPLTSAWQKFLTLLFTQAKPIRKKINNIGDSLLSLVGELKHR